MNKIICFKIKMLKFALHKFHIFLIHNEKILKQSFAMLILNYLKICYKIQED